MLPGISLIARTVLRFITSALCAVGVAALAGVGVLRLVATHPNPTWLAELSSFTLTTGVVCLATSCASFLMMPSIPEMQRRDPLAARPIESVGTLLLALLGIVAMLQFPDLSNWWNVDRQFLLDLTSGWNLGGFDIVPTVLVYSLPAVATALLCVFVATSAGAASSQRAVAKRFLIAGVFLQAGLLAVEHLATGELQEVAAAALHAFRDVPSANSGRIGDWLVRHDPMTRTFIYRAAATFAGYLVTLIVVFYSSRHAAPDAEDWSAPLQLSPEESAALMSTAVAVEPGVMPTPGDASAAFGESDYVFQARAGVVGLFLGRRFIDYELQVIPPKMHTHFSFSWPTGVMRRNPSGPDVFRLRYAECQGPLSAYKVIEAATGRVLGKVVPQDAGWTIVDDRDRTIANVVQNYAAFEREEYTIKVGDGEICRLTWLVGGTILNSEVDVEFRPQADRPFDRALSVALAPIIEDRARSARRFTDSEGSTI